MQPIRIEKFYGQVPLVTERLLPAGYAQTALNVDLLNGDIVPLKDYSVVVGAPTKAGTIKSIFYYRDQYWFHWLTDVDVVESAIAGETLDRVYWTGDGVPKMSDATLATGGPDYPTVSYTLGLPAPSIPTATPLGVADSPAVDTPVTYAYVYTFVDGFGQEGPASDAAIVTINTPQTVTVANMEVPISAGTNWTGAQKYIYRAVSGNTTVEYRFLAAVPLATTSYVDTEPDSSLAEVMTSLNYNAPPADMIGLTEMANGIMAGFSGKRVYLCEPYLPHAWPYDFAVHDNIVGLGAYGNTLLVMTEGTPYAIVGDHPETMSMERLEINQACVSKRGIADVGYGIIYPSPDGLMLFGTGTAEILTLDYIDREFWQTLKPESILGAHHDGRYIGFYDTGLGTKGSFEVNLRTKYITFSDIWATGAYKHPKTDSLYLAVDDGINSDICKWASSTAKTFTWKSGVLLTEKPKSLGAAQVLAKSYPLTFKLYADGSLLRTETVANNLPFRLPSGSLYSKVEVELIGAVEVQKVFLANTIKELKLA